MEAAARQALGAYYTPTALAEPLARWALRQAGDTVFDPSCGDGVHVTGADFESAVDKRSANWPP